MRHAEVLRSNPVSSRLARPFVYIASLRRTGSTVLAEALTNPPVSFIFREPHFGRNRFNLKQDDVARFAAMGLDLAALRERWLGDRKNRHLLDALKDEFIPTFAEHFLQLGVKEIRHEGWRTYAQAFPDMRVILTGRDPRDVYISLTNRFRAGLGSWKEEPTPETVAEALMEQFRYQKEMDAECTCLRVRYEDFCADPRELDSIREHIQSPLEEAGQIGTFLGGPERVRIAEHKLHGSTITTKQVCRWKTEADETLRAEALRLFDLMPEYVAFWGYDAH